VKNQVEDIPFPVKGNPVQITQVLVNLIANAADALAGASESWIKVTIQPRDQNLLFIVEDNGPGIPAAAMDKLWSPFYTTKPVGKGTGLGLSICKKIVEDHGGRIWVESENGKGTAFYFSIPNAFDYDRLMAEREKNAPSDDASSLSF